MVANLWNFIERDEGDKKYSIFIKLRKSLTLFAIIVTNEASDSKYYKIIILKDYFTFR